MGELDALPKNKKYARPLRNFMNATAIEEIHHDSHNDLINYTKKELGMNQKDYLNAVTESVRRPYNFISPDRYFDDDELSHEGGAYFSGDEDDHHLSPLKPRGDGHIDSALKQ